MFSCANQVANSTLVYGPARSVLKGTVEFFWPDVQGGVVRYEITDSNGKVTSVQPPKSVYSTPEGISITVVPSSVTPGHSQCVVDSTDPKVGLVSFVAVLKARVDNSVPGLAERIAFIEQSVAGSAPQGVAVRPATPTTIMTTVNALLKSLRDAGLIAK
ncbi:MAG: hypothetical protein EOM68_00040 [Spirochaetia bacterium]|nr:hypothetical protein [Spirochaetia bacterium]